MISPEIAQRVKELEIHTRRMLSGSKIGIQKSRQKGFGFEFDQLRSYQYGDDVRLIDWKSSARSQDNLLVRQYFEERNRTFIICLDVSASTMFGSGNVLKQDIMQQVSGILALAAQWGKDKVGLILFSDQIEKVIPAGHGQKHVHGLISEIFSHKAVSKKTDLNVLFEYVAARSPKRAVIFVISDFMSNNFQSSLKKLVFDKEVIALSCLDAQEEAFANVGLVWTQDLESGEMMLMSSSSKNISKLQKLQKQRIIDIRNILYQSGVDILHLNNHESYMQELLVFFQKRMMY